MGSEMCIRDRVPTDLFTITGSKGEFSLNKNNEPSSYPAFGESPRYTVPLIPLTLNPEDLMLYPVIVASDTAECP